MLNRITSKGADTVKRRQTKIARIHVNQHNIRANGKALKAAALRVGDDNAPTVRLKPPLRVKTGGKNHSASYVSIKHTPIGRALSDEVEYALIKLDALIERARPEDKAALTEVEAALKGVVAVSAPQVVARVVYREETPLSCGAKCWMEVDIGEHTMIHTVDRYGAGYAVHGAPEKWKLAKVQ